MKANFVFVILIYCLAINYTKAQVHYTYDASGNRTSRWVDVTPVPYHASSNDTTVELQVNNLLKQNKSTPDSEKGKTLAERRAGHDKGLPQPGGRKTQRGDTGRYWR